MTNMGTTTKKLSRM